MTGHYDIKIHQGDTFTKTFTFVDMDLSNFSIAMQWKNVSGTVIVDCKTSDKTILLSKDGDGNSVVSPVITAVQTGSITDSLLYYNLQLTSPSGVVTTVLEGTVSIQKDITTGA